MHENIRYLIETYTKLFLASSPIAMMALYLSMTPHYTPKERLRTSFSACHVSTGIMVICGIMGEAILRFIGIQMDSFRIAGGFVLSMMGVELLKAKDPDEQITEAERKEVLRSKRDITITPLAFPVISGPGMISSLMIAKSEACNWAQSLLSYVGIALIMVTFYGLFYITSVSSRWLSPTVLRISSRLSGLVLVALAIEFIAGGIKGFFKL